MTNNDEVYRKTVQEFKDVAEILVETPDISSELLDRQLKANQAKKTIEEIDKLKALGLQKRLMNAYYSDPITLKLSYINRLDALSKPAKAGLLSMIFWTAYVIYRTSDSHELMGRTLYDWDSRDFFMNWLALPVIITAIYFGIQWVITDRSAPKSVKTLSVEAQLDIEMLAWSKEQRQLSLQLVSRVLEQDHKSVFELVKKIEPDHFDRLVEFVYVMKKPPLTNELKN